MASQLQQQQHHHHSSSNTVSPSVSVSASASAGSSLSSSVPPPPLPPKSQPQSQTPTARPTSTVNPSPGTNANLNTNTPQLNSQILSVSTSVPSSQQQPPPPVTSFEFTRRKRWPDILINEVPENIMLVLSPNGKIWFSGVAMVELLGWTVEEVLDKDFLCFVNGTSFPLSVCVSLKF